MSTPGSSEASRLAALEVLTRLREAGHEAYFVGGCVREMLLGREPADHDVTTDARPERVEELFERVVPVGAKFGVVIVVIDGTPVEVATFRTEGGYVDGRRPTHVAFATVAEDVARRDFTVNALLHDPIEDRVIDHVGGRADLEDRVLRTVGDPDERFREDSLRLLRAVRFSASLGFTLDAATERAVRRHAGDVERISPERIRAELDRMVRHPTRGVAYRLLDQLGILELVLPEVGALHGVEQPVRYHPEGDVFTHVMLALDALPDEVGEAAAWATLLHDIGKPRTFTRGEDRIRFHGHEVVGAEMADGVLRRLRFSNEVRERVVQLVRWHLRPRDAPGMKRSTLRRFLAEPCFDDLLVVARADALAGSGDVSAVEFLVRSREELPPVPEPLVSGADLHGLLEPGPDYGRVLRAIREEQLEGGLATREAALDRLGALVREVTESRADSSDA